MAQKQQQQQHRAQTHFSGTMRHLHARPYIQQHAIQHQLVLSFSLLICSHPFFFCFSYSCFFLFSMAYLLFLHFIATFSGFYGVFCGVRAH